MKKTFYFAATALAVVSMASCSGSKKAEVAEPARAQQEVYSGILPSADADGVKYTLKLDYSSDSTFNSGVYNLEEAYLQADSLSSTGYKDLKTDNTNGNFSVIAGEGANAGKYYLKLVEEVQSTSDSVAAPMPIYFLVDSDSTLTMVNSQLEVSVNPDLNYTLKLE